MYRYLPKQWKLRIAGGLALFFGVIAGAPLMISVVLVLVVKFWSILLPLAMLAFVYRLLARWRR
jgi:predicted ABC-type sugar transport system permease subunit